MTEHDLEKNDKITYFEFKALLLDLDDVNKAEHYELVGEGETKQWNGKHRFEKQG